MKQAPTLRGISVFGTLNVFKIQLICSWYWKMCSCDLWRNTILIKNTAVKCNPLFFIQNMNATWGWPNKWKNEPLPSNRMGFSIWDIRCVQNRILIVHDIERCAPVIFDAIQFWSGKHLSSKTRHCLFKLWMPSTWVWGTKWRHKPLRSNRFQYLGV